MDLVMYIKKTNTNKKNKANLLWNMEAEEVAGCADI